MKHQVAQLLEDTREVLRRLDKAADAAEEKWHEKDEPRFRALRDMLTERLRRGKVITRGDVIIAFGDVDLSWPGPAKAAVFEDFRAGKTNRRRSPVAQIVTSRPNVRTSVYYQDLVDFATLLVRLREENSLPSNEFPRAHRFFVTDQELTDLGFSRFPSVVNRIMLVEGNLRPSTPVEVRA